jgi:hypothetical protein
MDGEQPAAEIGDQPPPADATTVGDATAPTGEGAPAVGDDGLPLAPADEKPSNIPPETLEDMKALWCVFDMEETNYVPIKELRTIMRALDIDLPPAELNLVRKQIDPEGEGFIKFEKL